MDIAFLIGRIVLGYFYYSSAMNHFSHPGVISGYAGYKGVPIPKLATWVSGVLLMIGALSIITGLYPVIGVIALALFFLPVSFMIHNYWTIKDPMAAMGEKVNFRKNMALLASALMFLAIPQPWPLSLGN